MYDLTDLEEREIFNAICDVHELDAQAVAQARRDRCCDSIGIDVQIHAGEAAE